MAKITPGTIAPRGRIGEQVGVKIKKVPTAPQISQKQLAGKAQENFVKAENKKIDNLIAEYNNNISILAKKAQAIAGIKGSSGELNQIDDDQLFYRKQIKNLNQSRQYITQGAAFEAAAGWAASKSDVELANIAAQQQAHIPNPPKLSEEQLIQQMRQGGIEYLKKHPNAFSVPDKTISIKTSTISPTTNGIIKSSQSSTGNNFLQLINQPSEFERVSGIDFKKFVPAKEYKKEIKGLYRKKTKELGIDYQEGWGIKDNDKGFFGNLNEDFSTSGVYKREGDKESIYMNKLSSLGRSEFNIAHEYGHALDNNNRSIFDISAKKGWFRFDDKWGYIDKQMLRENYANSFANYIKNPTKFKKKFPEQTEVFEDVLGYKGTNQASIGGASLVMPTTLPSTATLTDKYKAVETAASEKLYDITGFSEKQHEKQRADILASEKFLETQTSESSQFLISKGVPSWMVSTGDWIAGLGVKGGTMIAGFTGTVGKKTIDKPITTPSKYAALGAAGYGAGMLLTGGSAAVGGSSGIAATGAFGGGASGLVAPTVRWGSLALGGAFVTKTGTNIYAAPTSFERGGIIGESVFELGAISSGFVSGKSGAGKISDLWRTRGRTEVPAEDFILADVLSGKKRFVESSSYGYTGKSSGKAKQQFDIKIFEKKPYSYHVTPDQYWKESFTTIKGTSEFPGLYTAPSPSIYFGKVSPSGSGYKLNLFGGGFESPEKPSVARIFTKFTTKKDTSNAFVTGVKPEIEAVISPDITFGKTSGTQYFKFGGRRIPIDVFKKTEIGKMPNGKSSSPFEVSSSLSSQFNVPTYSLISPPTLALSSLLKSSKPSTSSVPSSRYFAPTPSSSTATSSLNISSVIPSSPTSSTIPSSSFTPTPSSSTATSSLNISSVIPSLSSVSKLYSPSSLFAPSPTKYPPILPSNKYRKEKKGISYLPQVRAGKRGNYKWTTVSSETMTRVGALSRASNVADNTTSRRIRIIKKNIAPQNMSSGNWDRRKHKFRPYKIKRGAKYKLPSSFIEKTSFAIDTIGEKQQLKAANYAQNKGWLVSNKKNVKNKRKSKSPWLV